MSEFAQFAIYQNVLAGKCANVPKPCSNCASVYHTAFNCPVRGRTPLKTTKPMQARRRINRSGKVSRAWIQARRQWIAQHPGPWECFYCLVPLTEPELTLDHYLSRARRPDLRYDHDNIVPCCAPCNYRKGSLSGDEYIELLKQENYD